MRAGLSALAAGLLLKLVGSDQVVVERVYAPDGSALVIGQGNTGSSTTTLSAPVAGGPAAFFDNAGTGDAQAFQGRSQSTAGRGLVGFASATSGATIALDGVCNSPDGIGLRGANTATTGNAIGVQGQTSSSAGAVFLGRGAGNAERIRILENGAIVTPNANIIEGFSGNTVTAGVVGATISGGGATGNLNRVTDDFGTVGGGQYNQAGDNAGITIDRVSATVGGGFHNTASGEHSTVSGGAQNTASGGFSTVPGGLFNVASGDMSFAAGRRAQANHQGAFVWADSTFADFASTGVDQFSVRCVGGARFVSAVDGGGNPTAGVSLAAGGGAWASISDRALKENFAAVDGRDMLERLSRIRITRWNLRSQPASVRHVGPMAQDFYAAFGLGEDDRHITTTDADGVALIGVQALYGIVQEKAREVARVLAELRAELHTLKRLMRLETEPMNP